MHTMGRRWTGSAVLAAPLVLAMGVGVATAAPALPGAVASPACTTSSLGVVTCQFASTGQEQQFVVPVGVSRVQVVAVGAAGGAVSLGRSGSVPGGAGAVVSTVLSVTAGQVLYVEVGGAGGPDGGPGGFNGGGAGSTLSGGGGGASDVRTQPRASAAGLASRILVAAGGGGAGGSSNRPSPVTPGGRGGDAGSAGKTPNGADFGLTGGSGGQPGTADAGGAGGAGGVPVSPCMTTLDPPGCSTGVAGSPGTAAVGGRGATGTSTEPVGGSGGGGGGGLYGGGGGGAGAFGLWQGLSAMGPGGGGGGGTSLVPAGATLTTNATSTPSQITVTYVPTGATVPGPGCRPEPTVPLTLTTVREWVLSLLARIHCSVNTSLGPIRTVS